VSLSRAPARDDRPRRAGRRLAGTLLLYFYVPISTGHTVALNGLRPLGDWSLGRPLHVAALFAGIVAGLFALYAVAYSASGAPATEPCAPGPPSTRRRRPPRSS